MFVSMYISDGSETQRMRLWLLKIPTQYQRLVMSGPCAVNSYKPGADTNEQQSPMAPASGGDQGAGEMRTAGRSRERTRGSGSGSGRGRRQRGRVQKQGGQVGLGDLHRLH